LLVGEKQVREALDKSKENRADYSIALLHHPFDWLKDFEVEDTKSLLMRGCNFILQGHLHISGIEMISSPDGSSIYLAAGALYAGRDYPNAYNIVHFDPVTGAGTVYLRRYSDRAGGFFASDNLTYRNVEKGEYNFSLRIGTPLPGARSAQTTMKQEQTLGNLQNSPLQTHIAENSQNQQRPSSLSEQSLQKREPAPSLPVASATHDHVMPFDESSQGPNGEIEMKLIDPARLNLTEALLNAYPDQKDFEIMLEAMLDKKLNTLVDDFHSYKMLIFKLIGRTEAEGWTKDLVFAAYEYRRRNLELQMWYQEYRSRQATQVVNDFLGQARNHIEEAQKSLKEASEPFNTEKNVVQPPQYREAIASLNTMNSHIEHLHKLLDESSPLPKEAASVHQSINKQIKIVTEQTEKLILLLEQNNPGEFTPIKDALNKIDELIPRKSS
jgi:hypothetical protein